MKTVITEEDGRVVIAVEGELDTETCGKFQEDIACLSGREGLAVELDLGRLDYISSKALRVVIALRQTIVSARGTMKITDVSPTVREVFDMTGLTASLLG